MFLMMFLSRFSNPAVLHHELGENTLCCLLDEVEALRKGDQFLCWEEWDGTLVLEVCCGKGSPVFQVYFMSALFTCSSSHC